MRRICVLITVITVISLVWIGYPSIGRASGVGISMPGHRADSVAATTGLFWAYRPGGGSSLMRRDLEFHWDAEYARDASALSAATRAALDSLGKALTESIDNPFGAPYSDFRLVYDYFHLQGPYYNASDPLDSTSVRLGLIRGALPVYPDRDRSHLDYYLIRPGHLTSSGLPPSGGAHISEFASAREDTGTGHTTALPLNSVHYTGPDEAALDDLGWARAYSPQVWGLDHELQHALPKVAGVGEQPLPNWSTEMFSAGAEVIAGVPHAAAANNEVPYTHSLLAHVWQNNPAPVLTDPCEEADRFYQSGYSTRRLFASYLAYNFRGADTQPAIPSSPEVLTGFGDDLLWRWARQTSGTGRVLTGLTTLLPTSPAYFSKIDPAGGQTTTLTGKDLLQLLHHNFRVANYLNAPGYGDGRYGYPTQFGFSPRTDVSAWKAFDNCTENILAVPPKVTMGGDWKQRAAVRVGSRKSDQGGISHRMVLQPFGAEYWILRSGAMNGTYGRSLVVTIGPESADQVCGGGGRLMASVATYSDQTDSLYKHPEWLQEVGAPLWVDSDTLAGELTFVVPDFGNPGGAVRRMAVVATITAADAPVAGEGYAGMNGLTITQKLSYGLNVELASAPFPQPFSQPAPAKVPVVANPGFNDGYAVWSPSGQEIAYHSQVGTGTSQIYRRAFSASNLNQPQVPIHSVPALNQYRPDWSPRGDWVVFEQDSAGANCDLYLKNLQTHELRRVSSGEQYEINAVFQPNGQGFVYMKSQWQAAPGGLRRFELRYRKLTGSTDAVLVGPGNGRFIQSPRWELDGSKVYYSRGDTLYSVRVQDGLVEVVPAPAGGDLVASFDLARGAGVKVYEHRGEAQEAGCPAPQLYRRLLTSRTGSAEDTRTRFHGRRSDMLDPRISLDGTRAVFTQAPFSADTDLYIGILTYNHAPHMNSGVVDQMLTAGVPYSINLATGATDPDGDPIFYKAAYLPQGSSFSGSTFSWPMPVVSGGENVFYTVFVAYDSAGAQDYRVIRYEIGGGGGCPFADVRTGSGWIEGNSVSRRSADLTAGPDAYRLPERPMPLDGRYLVRVRENETEESVLEGVHLLVVDRDPDVQSVAAAGRILQGRVMEPARVTNKLGEDVTALLSGPGSTGLMAEPGEVLLVEFGSRASAQEFDLTSSRSSPALTDEGDGGFYMESGGKELPPEIRSRPPFELASAGMDEQTLGLTGVDIQLPDANGSWRTMLRHYPRAKVDAAAFSDVPTGSVRLVFVGRHQVRSLGRIVAGSGATAPVRLDPVTALHTRFGNVQDAVRGNKTPGTTLVQGDTLELAFKAPPLKEGLERDFYLVTNGAYRTATRAQASESSGDLRNAAFAFSLGVARPNPSRGVTVIPFALPTSSTVQLQVYDASGRLVRSLLQDERSAGLHEIEWDRRTDSGARVGAGIYFYKLVVPDREATRKVVILGD